MNINQLNVIWYKITTLNLNKIKFYTFTLTESLCKRHCKVPALIFIDTGVMQRSYFIVEVPTLLLLDMAALSLLI
jgi:hypothetical protein